MKHIATTILIIIINLCTYTYADTADNLLVKLKKTHINGIDAALIRLDLFSAQQNKQLEKKKTQLKFIYTYDRLELSAFIRKPRPGMTINECLNYLKRIKNDYPNMTLSETAFPKYANIDKKIAGQLFTHQVLLVDEKDPELVVSCR